MSARPASPRCGLALVELLIAITLIELVAILAMAAAVTAHRLDRATRLRATFDLARRDTVAVAAATPSCRGAPTAAAQPLTLPAGPGRPQLRVAIRCGR